MVRDETAGELHMGGELLVVLALLLMTNMQPCFCTLYASGSCLSYTSQPYVGLAGGYRAAEANAVLPDLDRYT